MLEKKESKIKNVSSKITNSQDEKLIKLAEKYDISKSNLISQLLEIGYKNITKNKTF